MTTFNLRNIVIQKMNKNFEFLFNIIAIDILQLIFNNRFNTLSIYFVAIHIDLFDIHNIFLKEFVRYIKNAIVVYEVCDERIQNEVHDYYMK